MWFFVKFKIKIIFFVILYQKKVTAIDYIMKIFPADVVRYNLLHIFALLYFCCVKNFLKKRFLDRAAIIRNN